jgi:ATP-binding cassette subfamily B protein
MMAFGALNRMAVRAVLMVAFSLTMSFKINSGIAFIFVCVIPVLCFGLFSIALHVHPIFVRAFDRYDDLNNIVSENLRGIRVVKSFVREISEIKKFGVISGEIYNDFSKAQKRVTMNMPFLQLCIYSCTILISWIGAKMIVSRVMTTGELMSVISYSMQILMSLMMLSFVFVMIIISRTSAYRVSEVLNEEPSLKNPENPVTGVKDGSISFKNVDFSYVGDKRKLCLKKINLDIKSGETIGIIGGTGSSKSSLIQLIPRIYDATDGNITVGGVDVRNYDLETIRNAVAVVLQKNTLFSGTIKENLLWGDPNATDEDLRRACRFAQADGFIEAFPNGYDTYIEQDGTNVSGGQKQRLCIARALLKNPKILILDDSTSAVDTKTDAAIRKAFREEIPGVTKLIIAQRVASVRDADRIIVMESGEINAVGTHDGLLKNNPIYQEVYNAQSQGGGDFDEENG